MKLESIKEYMIKNLDLLSLLIITAILTLYNIHKLPIIDGDSAFYAKIAKNIIESGNWLTFRYIHPNDIIDKPPLAFWPNALSFMIFGINTFAVHIWHALFSISVVVMTFLMGKDLFNRKIALYSGLILITMLQFFYQTRLPLQDMPLTLFIGLALFNSYQYLNSKRIQHYYLAILFTALSFLVKGPVGVALIAPIIFLYFLIMRTAPFKNSKEYLFRGTLGALLFFIVGCSWYLHQYLVWGKPFLDVYWLRNAGRFFRPVDIATEPQLDFYFHAVFLLIATLPWGGFLYTAIYNAYRKINENRKELIFLLIWFFVILLFFSVSTNVKIPRYMLPAYPAIAIMIGKLFNDMTENKEKYRMLINISVSTTLLLTIPLMIFILYGIAGKFEAIFYDYFQIFIPFLSILSIGVMAFCALILLRSIKAAFYTVIIFTILSFLVFLYKGTILFPQLKPYQSYSEIINAELSKDTVVLHYPGPPDAFWVYYINKRVDPISSKKELVNLLRSNKKILVVSDNKEAIGSIKQSYNINILKENKHGYILFTN